VCRAYGLAPDEIRAWEYRDYLDAQESIAEIPLIEQLVKGLFGGKPEPKKSTSLKTKAGRNEVLAKLEEKPEPQA